MSRSGSMRLGAAVLSLALMSLFVARGTYAAFTGTTSNSGNSWSTGTVTIRDDDSDSALFTATG